MGCELHDWRLSKHCTSWVARGAVYNDHRFFDGQRIRTSVVTSITPGDVSIDVATKNSTYTCPYAECSDSTLDFVNDVALIGAGSPSRKEEVCNCLIWRQKNATRNSIESVGRLTSPTKSFSGRHAMRYRRCCGRREISTGTTFLSSVGVEYVATTSPDPLLCRSEKPWEHH